MREVTYQDAIAVGQVLNIHRDEVWKVVKGLRYGDESELWMAVHDAFRIPAPSPKGTIGSGPDLPEAPGG
jgi:hypothetical protein